MLYRVHFFFFLRPPRLRSSVPRPKSFGVSKKGVKPNVVATESYSCFAIIFFFFFVDLIVVGLLIELHFPVHAKLFYWDEV